ncbi:MAG: hypothetical protein ACT4QD_08795 [Acidobacteriota bacterium]
MVPVLLHLVAFLLVASSAAGQVADRAETALRGVLQQYSTALASLDADAVKKVHPSVDVENLRKAFREMRTLEVAIDDVKVLSSDASIARLSCRVNQTLTPKAGTKRSTSVTRVLRLRRLDAGWVIESFER